MTDENTPSIPDMTDAECATAYRDLRKRANDAGFATVGEWIDEQPDTQDTDPLGEGEEYGVTGEWWGTQPDTDGLADKQLAYKFHETYERLAPQFGYETRDDTKEFDASTPNGRLMTAVCSEIRAHIRRTDRKAVLEEAAQIVIAMIERENGRGDDGNGDYVSAWEKAVDNIRALKKLESTQ